ncbi:MAG: type VI secretion system protein TssA [Desulfosarcina sp.]|nr:type VI secretion system protein TssA [Desulfobacterales bacterium]
MIEIDPVLTPISENKPAGEDLRYDAVFDQLKEARRSDDLLEQGDWVTDVKQADWNKVISIAVEALSQRTKDLQIAAWLTEGLIQTDGFKGLITGLKIITAFLTNFWDHLYPLIEDDDLDYRAGPLEFINNRLSVAIQGIPITDKNVTAGYSWFKWHESRQVGYEADMRNKYGDVDDSKKKSRDQLIAEGKLTAENFDAAVAGSSKSFYQDLAKNLLESVEVFKQLDEIVDKKFGSHAPRLAELKKAIEDCNQIINKIFQEKKIKEPDIDPEPDLESASDSGPESGSQTEETHASNTDINNNTKVEELFVNQQDKILTMAAIPLPAYRHSDSGVQEKSVWKKAGDILKASGINKSLDLLLSAYCSAPSVREKNRYLLCMAKICLKAERPDLARPIVEKLSATIEELQLERWESPIWIGEVLDALYQCLTSGEPTNDDIGRANQLFQRLCSIDITKAINCKK